VSGQPPSPAIIAAQSTAVEPEPFQRRLIESISKALLREVAPPCLLRAPTGAGKTLIISRVLQKVSLKRETLWFWFVPYVNLVQQTEDSIAANAPALKPFRLSEGKSADPRSGQVLISTAAAVARQRSRSQDYTDGTDDVQRSLSDLRDLARARGLRIGLVVDEAHIALAAQTEFGEFARWLRPDCLLMASATPKDDRLAEFMAKAGYEGNEAFQVARDEVVHARLNKRYIDAVVYDLRQSTAGIADLQQTVLRQAWKRNLRLKKLLMAQGMEVTPLLLVQVANGADSIKEARECLIRVCNVEPAAIGEHSSDEPDPVMMASIANDSSKEVLIFKQSAGTGFDAPRAFVLASTKPVNAPDFAMQFIGRVMRVHRSVRLRFPPKTQVPVDLDTAYVYLANAEAQQGFEQAVAATQNLKSSLDGQVERLVAKRMMSGAVLYTNRPTSEPPLFFEGPEEEAPRPAVPGATAAPTAAKLGATPTAPVPIGVDGAAQDALDAMAAAAGNSAEPGLFDDGTPLDEAEGRQEQATAKAKRKKTKPSRSEVIRALDELGVAAFELRRELVQLPTAMKREERPLMQDMESASRNAAARVEITAALSKMAIQVALGRVTEKEVHTELTTLTRTEEDVAVVIGRDRLAKLARGVLAALPQVEDSDSAVIIDVLAKRLRPSLDGEFVHLDRDDRPPALELERKARDAAHWVIYRSGVQLAELLHAEISSQARLVDAMPLPDRMLFAKAIQLRRSTKNIYGVMPPGNADLDRLPDVLTIDARDLLAQRDVELAGGGTVRLAEYDRTHSLGKGERDFAVALDNAEFVHWWHRNPDRKPFSVAVMRGEHQNYFYPDFVVCLDHFPGDEPLLRLIETKHDTKDAARKARHVPRFYGHVLFLTKDQDVVRWVKEDGSVGEAVDLDDLSSMQNWLRSTRPRAEA
jgi:type III restriction enzyme